MAIPSFKDFQWLHQQPDWSQSQPLGPGAEPSYQARIRTARFERWQPLWKLLLVKPGFSDYQVGALLRLKDEYEQGFGRKG
jgi:hypothetical protein